MSRITTGACFLGLLWLLAPVVSTATLRMSIGNGAWDQISWSPSGTPVDGDALIIASRVAGMPPGNYGSLEIRPTASLSVRSGVCRVTSLTNSGILWIPNGGVLKVSGDILNDGAAPGAGSIEMTADGGGISGSGALANLTLNAGTGSILHSIGPVTLGSLYVATGQLRIGASSLIVNGTFYSNAPLGDPAIVATTGTITLNGTVYGSASGALIQLGGGDASATAIPTTYGNLGQAGAVIVFSASRQLSFCTLTGMVVVNAGVTIQGDGIGPSGINTIRGMLANSGTVIALDERYRWRIEGDIHNVGLVDNCTVLMTGHDVQVQTESGLWGRDASLSFISDAGGRLRLRGVTILPRLEIGTLSAGDSDVVVDAGTNELLVRHGFTSNQARGCRLTTDTIVRLRDAANGIIAGNVSFEGFWDSELGGDYGGTGKTVSMMMPKRIVSPTRINGLLAQRPNAELTITSTLSVPAGSELSADFIIGPAGKLTVPGDLTLDRSGRGGGVIELTGSAALLDVRGLLGDSLLLGIGRDSLAVQVTAARAFSVPRMTIYAGSSITYPPGDSIGVIRNFRYRIAAVLGFSMMSTASDPFDHLAATAFPGAGSPVFRFDNAAGYLVTDSVRPGESYWVSYPSPVVIEQSGAFINAPLTVPVHGGWNMIGGASIPIATSRIAVNGTQRLSDFYELAGGYQSATLLIPGRGYWVQFSGDGTITLNP